MLRRILISVISLILLCSAAVGCAPIGATQPEAGQDDYFTDPVPEGKPEPVEPDESEKDPEKAYSCFLTIRCDTIYDNLGSLKPNKVPVLPEDGVISSPDGSVRYDRREVVFYEGESVYDLLYREMKDNGIQMEQRWTPIYNSHYIVGIANLYEFDCGDLSGWMYSVDDWFPNYGCSRFVLYEGADVNWLYTCDLGRDLGQEWVG